MRQKKAILYIRVSTDEQAEKGHSLAHQRDMLQKYCAINNIETVALYKEDYSAKTFDRPEFNNIITTLRKNRGMAELLLFLKWDRFSRNAPEAYTMISQLHKLGIEPQAIEQPLNMEIPEQKFLLALYLTAPEVENDRRALNIIAGIRKAMKDGRYMGSAPYGYKHSRTESNKPCIAPNEKELRFVQKAFEMMATGKYHIEELRHILRKKGMPLGRTRFWCMLRNPVYMGKVAVPAYKTEPGMMVKATHEAIISEAIYYEVQDVLEGRKRNLPISPFCQKEELPLRGFLICAKCGNPLTGSASKGRSARYYYYHCKNGCKERFRASEANEKFEQMLAYVGNMDKIYRSCELIMSGAHKKNGQDKSNEISAAKKELEICKKRLENAQTLMLDGELDAAEYRKIKSKLEPELERIATKISQLSKNDNNKKEVIDFGFYFLRNMNKLFAGASIDNKRHFLGSTFPEKLIYENGTYRTASNENILILIANTGKGLAEKKKGKQGLSCLPSRGVEPAGFEPASKHMPDKLSTCVFLDWISEVGRTRTNQPTS